MIQSIQQIQRMILIVVENMVFYINQIVIYTKKLVYWFKMFEFPTNEQLQKFQNVLSKSTILTLLEGFSHDQDFKHKHIQYQTETYQQGNEEEEIVDHFMIQFKCCTGIGNHRPFLHFVKNKNGVFEINGQDCWHDHSLMEQKESFKSKLDQINEIKDVLSKSMEQKENQNEKIDTFDFPFQSQLDNLREFIGIDTIKLAFKRLSQQLQHKDKSIKFQYQQITPNSAVINSILNILFQCCNEQCEPAFLSYTSSDGRKYKLSKSYNLKHVHDKKQEVINNQVQQQENENIEHQQKFIINNYVEEQIIDEKFDQNYEMIEQQKVDENNNDVQIQQQQQMRQEPDKYDIERQQVNVHIGQQQQMQQEKFDNIEQQSEQIQNKVMQSQEIIQASSSSSSLNNPLFDNLKPVDRAKQLNQEQLKNIKVQVINNEIKINKNIQQKVEQPKILTRSQRQALAKLKKIEQKKKYQMKNQQQNKSQEDQSFDSEDQREDSHQEQNSSQNKQHSQSKQSELNQISQQSLGDQISVLIFPKKQELNNFKSGTLAKVRSAIYFLVKNKYQNQIKQHSKTYQTKDQKGKTVYNLKVYFDCCKVTKNNKPFLLYTSTTSKNGFYSLKGINQKHYHTEVKDKLKNKDQKDVQSEKRKNEKQLQFIPQKKQLRNKNLSESYQVRALETSKTTRQVFMFPSGTDIEHIRPFSITSIRQDLNKLAFRKHKRIKFHCQAEDKNNLKFYFDCCKGFDNLVPFIHFSFVSYEQIFLIDSSNVWHDHRKKIDQNNQKQKQSKMLEEKEQNLEEQFQEVQDENQNQNSDGDDQNENENQSQENEEESQLQEDQQEQQNSQEQQNEQDSHEHNEQQRSEQLESNRNEPDQKDKLLRRLRIRQIQKPNKQQRSITTQNKKQQQKSQDNKTPSKDEKPQKGYQIRAYWISKQENSVFQFPSNKQLKRFDNKTLASLRSKVSKLSKQYKTKGLQYYSQIEQIRDKNNKINHHYNVYFSCCEGFQNQKPLMQFVRKNKETHYTLVKANRWHDHGSEKSQSKKLQSKSEEKMVNHKTNLSNVKRNHIQNPNSVKRTRSFVSGNDLNDKSKRQQLSNKSKSSNQLHKTKLIFKAFIPNKNHRTQRPQDYVTPARKIQKDYSSSQEQPNQQYEPQRSVIEISSSNQSQNRRINTIYHVQKKQILSSNLVKKQDRLPQNNGKCHDQSEKVLQKNQKFSFTSMNNKIQISNRKQKILQESLVYYWFQKYNQKLSNFLLQKRLNNQSNKKLQQNMRIQFNQYFSQSENNSKSNQQIWNKCIFKMIQHNQIDILELDSDQNSFNFQNLLFLKKVENLSKLTNQKGEIKIYLAVYPFKIASDSQALKIFLGYILISQLSPQILWFYVSKENSKQVNFEDFMDDNPQQDNFDEVLKMSIKYFKLKNLNVNFIYTTLDYQMIIALDKICQTSSQLNSQKRFSSTMHLSCIDALLKTETISQNSQLGNQIGTRIKRSPNFSNIKASYKILKNILDKDPYQTKNLNPRVIYDHYSTFSEPFSNKSTKDSFQSVLAFFSSELLYNKMEKSMIEDPVSQLNQIFSQCNKFNHISEVFILMIKFFDPTQRKLLKMTKNTSIVPSELYETKKQWLNFQSVRDKYFESQYSFDKIIVEPIYELVLVIKHCPRFIIQTIYRLIIAVNQLTLKRKNQYMIPKNPKLYQFKDNLQNGKTYKVSLLSYEQQTRNHRLSKDQLNKRDKKWLCECNFYTQTGIPCEHQLLATLINKDSLFKEINQCWKQKEY